MLLRRFTTLSLSFVCALSLAAQDVAAPAPAAKTLRVHIVGASVSGGFRDGPLMGAKEQGDSVPLVEVLKAWAGDDAKVTTHNTPRMTGMFTEPEKIGLEQIQGALRAKPDLLVAIDFPFWFAYGHVQGEEGAARKALLAKGLELLARVDAPMLIGDLPDMQGAARRMLHPRQIPGPALLTELNAQLAAFAKARKNVHVVSLASIVRTMKDEGVTLPLAGGPLRTGPGALQQEDRLHATRLGMAFLGLTLQEPLGAMFPPEHALRTRRWTIEQFLEATGAEGDLAVVKENAAKAAKAAEAKAGAEGGK